MAFRRQDIPKTTRKPEEGGPRRIYPRFLRDRTILPKVDLAIDYLDSMVGQRRGDLSPDMLLDLFGDPKLARCLLSCMGEHYVYRTKELADEVGSEAAAALTKWSICTPADLRGYLYLAANATRDGFVTGGERESFLAETGEVLGLTAAQLEELIHLDAERNAVLLRVGSRPKAEDVVARYNVVLTLSVLRHASNVTLELPGLSARTVEAVCARHEVPHQTTDSGQLKLHGRKSAVGTWSGFGARLARCVVQLLVLCPKTPAGEARVHFGDQVFRFVIDAKCTSALRPKLRTASSADAISATSALADDLILHRRETGEMAGWRVRRWPEPVVVEGTVVVPELAFTRGQVSVAAVAVPSGPDGAGTLAALKEVNRARPVVALGLPGGMNGVPSVSSYDPGEVVSLLEEIASSAADSTPSTHNLITDELATANWLSIERLQELLRGVTDLESAVAPFAHDGGVFVPGFGLCQVGLLDELQKPLGDGPIDIAELRRQVAARVGEAPGADALTLYLLTSSRVTSTAHSVSTPRAA